MVNFSYEVINQIKAATDDSHVKIIIDTSIKNWNTKNAYGVSSKRKLMINMEMALRYVKAQGLDPKALQNVNTAIEIVEQLRKQEYGYLF
jgi:hypothetical protein